MRKFLALIIVLAWGLPLFSQTHYTSNVSVGGRAGIDLSYVSFSPAIKQSWPVNPTLGVSIRYIEENHFGLIAELNYVRRGWKENFEGLPFRYQRNIDYLEIPVFAHIYFGRENKFFINAGPQIAFKLSDSYSANFDPYEINSIPDFPLRNRRNAQLTEKITQKVDYGISAGLGYERAINAKHAVSLEARYYFGLGNIVSAKRQANFRASNTMYIAITAGYWFRFK